jgi:hypothetical protein
MVASSPLPKSHRQIFEVTSAWTAAQMHAIINSAAAADSGSTPVVQLAADPSRKPFSTRTILLHPAEKPSLLLS